MRNVEIMAQTTVQSQLAVAQIMAEGEAALSQPPPQLQLPTPPQHHLNTKPQLQLHLPTPPQHQTPTTPQLQPQPHSHETYQSVFEDLTQSLQSLKQYTTQIKLLLAKTPSLPRFQLQPQFLRHFDQTSQPLCRGDLHGPHTTGAGLSHRIQLISRIHCQESNEESLEIEYASFLKCHVSEEVNHLHEGLKHGLKSKLEKASPALGRSAMFLKESRINALPRFLNIQFARYFWNKESNMLDKILQKVDYPPELDVYDFCSDDLRKKLEAPRQGSSSGGRRSFAVPMKGEKETQMNRIYNLSMVLNFKGRYVGWLNLENGKWKEFDRDNRYGNLKEVDVTSLFGEDDWLMPDMIVYKARA